MPGESLHAGQAGVAAEARVAGASRLAGRAQSPVLAARPARTLRTYEQPTAAKLQLPPPRDRATRRLTE